MPVLHAHSVDYVARKIKAGLKRLFADGSYTTAIVHLSAGLVDEMFKDRLFSSDCETIWSGKRIYFVPEQNLLNRNFTIKGSADAAVSVPPSARLLY